MISVTELSLHATHNMLCVNKTSFLVACWRWWPLRRRILLVHGHWTCRCRL